MTSHALSFGAAAHLYDAIRPTYPADAVAWAVGQAPLRVLDLGAGTGRLTEVLLDAGHEVVAVEPDPQMLAVLSGRHPRATALAGSAEAIPLPEGTVDAVVCGQAYHWFDRQAALPEIARVLVPGGTFAPVWNLRDETVAWVAALSAIIGSEGADLARSDGVGDFGPWFGGTEHGVFEHSAEITPDGLVDLVMSRSYYLTADDATRAQMVAAVRGLAATHPDLAGNARFTLPYRTHVYRSRRA
jgi:SAM-dependent methyltransferase